MGPADAGASLREGCYGVVFWRRLVLGALAAVALLASTAVAVRNYDYGEGGFRRCRTDQAAAIGSYLQAAFPQSLPGLGGAPWEPLIDRYYHDVLASRVRAEGLRPWQPWATVPPRPFLRVSGATAVPFYDDPGRARLLGLGFRLLGGVSPFLILWVAPILAALVLAWAVAEARDHLPAALVFALLFVASPYAVETLAETRWAVGFHLAALLLLLPLGFAAIREPAPGWAAWLSRVGLAGTVFAACAVCRGTALLLLPAFFALLVVGCHRVSALTGSRTRGTVGMLVTLALFLGPYVAVRPAQGHELWSGVWQGLGDFDRTKGHAWSDRAAAEVVWKAQGHRRPLPRIGGDALVEWNSLPASQAVLRREVLAHIQGDPAWFAAIVGQRAVATLTLRYLWPWGPRDGRSYGEAGAACNFQHKYWDYVTTADWLGWGPWRIELPVSLLLVPTVLFVAGALRNRRRPGAAAPGSLSLLGALALGGSLVPIAITTATGTETQTVVVAYYFGAALLAQALWRTARGRGGAGPPSLDAGGPHPDPAAPLA